MKTIYSHISDLAHAFHTLTVDQKTSREISEAMQVQLNRVIKINTTASGRVKLLKRELSALNCALYAMKEQFNNSTEFCYVVDGELYSNRKNTIYKSMEILHQRGYTQSQWDSFPRGMFYSTNSAPYAVYECASSKVAIQ